MPRAEGGPRAVGAGPHAGWSEALAPAPGAPSAVGGGTSRPGSRDPLRRRGRHSLLPCRPVLSLQFHCQMERLSRMTLNTCTSPPGHLSCPESFRRSLAVSVEVISWDRNECHQGHPREGLSVTVPEHWCTGRACQ